LGANGAIYAVRRELFRPPAASLVEDFQVPLDIRFSGYRVVYDPEVVATEDIAPSLRAQFQRRVRIGAGNYQTLFRNPGFLNPWNGAPAFAFISHRLLRWLSPFLLMVALISNFGLACHSTGTVYPLLLVFQCVFYVMAAAGCWLRNSGRSARFFSFPLQFCLMNIAFVLGLLRYLTGRQALAWQATPRQVVLAESVSNAKAR
jgi:cellulose synthase/poly-beta-1,6-N-acetylglucosamine synthase-like glycosyltransferase